MGEESGYLFLRACVSVYANLRFSVRVSAFVCVRVFVCVPVRANAIVCMCL